MDNYKGRTVVSRMNMSVGSGLVGKVQARGINPGEGTHSSLLLNKEKESFIYTR